jgi:kynurenine formamidase
LFVSTIAGAQTWKPPAESERCPSKWGASGEQISAPVHQIMLVVHGIHLLENLKLDELAAKGAHEFAFVMQPLKIQGGTGSTVAPVAIR